MSEISIIIPVYNSEKYISRCIESIAKQTFSDFEAICINDGSKDNSLSVLNELSEKYSFLKIINQENKGASSARNTGLENASGNYFCFVDSDDWVEPDYLSVLISNMKNYNADLSMIGINKIENYSSTPVFLYNETRTASSEDEIRMLQAGCYCNRLTDFQTDFIGMGTPWDKLFKTEIIKRNNIRFEEKLKTGEDTFFCWNYFNHVKRFIYQNKSLYNYVVYTDSLSRKYVELNDFFANAEIFSSSINENQAEITKNSINYNIFRHYLSLLKKHFAVNKNKLTLKDYKQELKSVLKNEILKDAVKNISPECLSKKEKLILKLNGFPSLFASMLYFTAAKN